MKLKRSIGLKKMVWNYAGTYVIAARVEQHAGQLVGSYRERYLSRLARVDTSMSISKVSGWIASKIMDVASLCS